MLVLVARTANIAVNAVVCSVTFGAWLQLSPALKSFNGPVYAQVQQRVLRGLKRFMPFVLLASLATTILDVVVIHREGAGPFDFTLAAFAFLLLFLYVTFRYELPINAEVDNWKAEQPPADWAAKRERWERWQSVRAWLSVGTLASLIGASLFSNGVCN